MDPDSAADFDRERSMVVQASESDPLLGGGDDTAKKPFYRARPLWCVDAFCAKANSLLIPAYQARALRHYCGSCSELFISRRLTAPPTTCN